VSAARRRGPAKGGACPGASSRSPAARSGGRGPAEPKRRRGREPAAQSAAPSGAGLATRLGGWTVAAVVALPPFLLSATAEDAFRLPKLAASETLALLSLLVLAAGWWSRSAVSLADLARQPATGFAALLAAAVLPGSIAALHPLHWQRATTSLVIALGCVVVWSVRLEPRVLRRTLDLLALPAGALALLAVLQAHGIFRPFGFAGSHAPRYQVTSLAGSVGDLGAYLVLPALVLQVGLALGGSPLARSVKGVLLALVVYALFLSETLAALLAAGAASLLLWAILLPWRKLWRAAVALAMAAGVATLLPGLTRRLSDKLDELHDLEFDSLLSGRLDGWKAALEMLREHPWLGVGHGGYGSSFAVGIVGLLYRVF
jgi:O-antigen ligase